MVGERPQLSAHPAASLQPASGILTPAASSWLKPVVRARHFSSTAPALPDIVGLGPPSARRGANAPLDVDAPDHRTTSRPTNPPCGQRRRGTRALNGRRRAAARLPPPPQGARMPCPVGTKKEAGGVLPRPPYPLGTSFHYGWFVGVICATVASSALPPEPPPLPV